MESITLSEEWMGSGVGDKVEEIGGEEGVGTGIDM